jgi:hypothetical protein
MVPNPERKSAKCADSHEEADDIAEPPPHLQDREGDVAEDGIQPRDDGCHGRSPGIAADVTLPCHDAKDAALRTAAPFGTSRKPRRVMPDPDLHARGMVPHHITAAIEGGCYCVGQANGTHVRNGSPTDL